MGVISETSEMCSSGTRVAFHFKFLCPSCGLFAHYIFAHVDQIPATNYVIFGTKASKLVYKKSNISQFSSLFHSVTVQFCK